MALVEGTYGLREEWELSGAMRLRLEEEIFTICLLQDHLHLDGPGYIPP